MIVVERDAAGERIADIHRMITSLWNESGCSKWLPANPADVMAFIHECRGACGYCAVAVDSETDDTAGCLLGFIGELPFNRKVRVAREVILWVDPQHRGHALGDKLCSDFAAWSKESGASMASIGSTYGFGEAYIKKIADSLGFEVQETMYLRRA